MTESAVVGSADGSDRVSHAGGAYARGGVGDRRDDRRYVPPPRVEMEMWI